MIKRLESGGSTGSKRSSRGAKAILTAIWFNWVYIKEIIQNNARSCPTSNFSLSNVVIDISFFFFFCDTIDNVGGSYDSII